MKKQTRLKLNKETVRLLRSDALAGVRAGYTTINQTGNTDEMGQCNTGYTCECGPTPTRHWCISDGGSCPPECP